MYDIVCNMVGIKNLIAPQRLIVISLQLAEAIVEPQLYKHISPIIVYIRWYPSDKSHCNITVAFCVPSENGTARHRARACLDGKMPRCIVDIITTLIRKIVVLHKWYCTWRVKRIHVEIGNINGDDMARTDDCLRLTLVMNSGRYSWYSESHYSP